VAIVGAGPYGLSIAAHLKKAKIPFRIFGTPLSTWREHMPQGMLLKSDGFASGLSDPDSSFTLKTYCIERDIRYDDTVVPVPIEVFIDYGLAFQKQFVPELEERQVLKITQEGDTYLLTLEGGEMVRAKQVVLAVGITHFQRIPPELAHLPSELLSHSSSHHDLSAFRNRNVTVIGSGASALDLAALLHEAGADTSLVARASNVRFHQKPGTRRPSTWDRIRHPQSPIGPGLRSRIYSDAPLLFRLLPGPMRRKIVREHLGPSAGWPMKTRVVGKVPLILGYQIRGAKLVDGMVQLDLQAASGAIRRHSTQHVICATGYQPDLERLHFLDPMIRSQVQTIDNVPILSMNFESSVPGLYLVGLAAAESFGPLLRFACGSDFTAQRITKHFAKRRAG
jgi:thioredoxin reductase